MVRLYNTLTRTIEDFQPINPPTVTYYSCGPTVYDYAHIGHARTFVFADILHRVLLLNNFQVKRVMNITDVGHLTSDADTGEDKMEKGAARENKTVWDIAAFYTEDFFTMLDALKIQTPETVCKATDHIAGMIHMIEDLEKKGFTYRIADGMYFDTAKFPAYGQLTGMSLAELQKRLKAGARVEMVVGKRNPTDFALWKFSDLVSKRQMEWDSPWGKGFPGWHIECSAMSMKFLGETLDIHTGGIDHVPVHHTNEIAQSEAATGKPFVRFWLHGEHLLVDGQKMSKSLGNFYRLKDVAEKGLSPLALRYLFLTVGYRKQLNFTWNSLEGAQKALKELQSKSTIILSSRAKSNDHISRFIDALNDDLNTAKALAVLWDGIKGDSTPEEKHALVRMADEVFQLDLMGKTSHAEVEQIPEEIMRLVHSREKFRSEKKWEESDKVRAVIEEKGYTLKDAATGTEVRKN